MSLGARGAICGNNSRAESHEDVHFDQLFGATIVLFSYEPTAHTPRLMARIV